MQFLFRDFRSIILREKFNANRAELPFSFSYFAYHGRNGNQFGMVLGAMAGQIGLIFAMDWNIGGIYGLVFAALAGTPLDCFRLACWNNFEQSKRTRNGNELYFPIFL